MRQQPTECSLAARKRTSGEPHTAPRKGCLQMLQPRHELLLIRPATPATQLKTRPLFGPSPREAPGSTFAARTIPFPGELPAELPAPPAPALHPGSAAAGHAPSTPGLALPAADGGGQPLPPSPDPARRQQQKLPRGRRLPWRGPLRSALWKRLSALLCWPQRLSPPWPGLVSIVLPRPANPAPPSQHQRARRPAPWLLAGHAPL
mmetsp:Transcript_115694/g.265641  ORF Transcript_115694/g.265641 Transcript_115694/m.265641 type:complete len:205 (+) Transcript_115694:1410-2024(+)